MITTFKILADIAFVSKWSIDDDAWVSTATKILAINMEWPTCDTSNNKDEKISIKI